MYGARKWQAVESCGGDGMLLSKRHVLYNGVKFYSMFRSFPGNGLCPKIALLIWDN
jgi:hypothetical protein